jgi:hypothetical protein
MSNVISRRTTGVLLALGVLLATVFVAAPQADSATLFACVKKNGSARISSKTPKCKKGESKFSWNTSGVNGKNGANGKDGANGAGGANGTNGKEGAAGQPQKAVSFNKTLESSFEPPSAVSLFTLAGVSVKLTCFFFLANFNLLEATGPENSFAQTGFAVTNSKGEIPEVTQETVKSVALGASFTKISQLSTNTKAPLANIAHLNGSIITPSAVVLIDAFLEAGPNPKGCVARGTAFSIPL